MWSSALSVGLAVTIALQSMTLTTRQAANLLGISRPTLVKILNDGAIPRPLSCAPADSAASNLFHPVEPGPNG